MEQPTDHPVAGGLLHHLLTLTPLHEAVIFFFRHQLSPTASTFRSGVPYAARTFLPCPALSSKDRGGWHQRQAETLLSDRKGNTFFLIQT